MTKSYYKTKLPINQAEVIPLSERTKLYQEIHKNLLKLERLNPRGIKMVKNYINYSIQDELEGQKNKGAEIIPFSGGAI